MNATHETHQHHSTAAAVAVWAILVTLLVASLLLGHLPNVYVMNALVFSVAIIKATLVLVKFMHVRMEPKVIAVTMLAAALFVTILVFGAAPDVTNKYRVSETPTSL